MQSTLPTFLDSLIREFPLMQRSLPIARPQNSPQKKAWKWKRKRVPSGRVRRRRKGPPIRQPSLRARIGAVRAVPHISGPWLDADELTVASTPLTANLCCAPSRQPPTPTPQPVVLRRTREGFVSFPRQGFRDEEARAVGGDNSSINTARRLFNTRCIIPQRRLINAKMRDDETFCRHERKQDAKVAQRESMAC